MPTFSCNVKPRAQLTPDSEGKYHLTPEKLNDMANPIVSVNLDVETFAPSVQITVGAKTGGTTIPVTFQAILGGQALFTRLRLFAYLTQNLSSLEPAAILPETMPDGWSSGQVNLITDTAGRIDFEIRHSGSDTWYIVVSAPTGTVVISPALTF